jgi:hypothetical protein
MSKKRGRKISRNEQSSAPKLEEERSPSDENESAEIVPIVVPILNFEEHEPEALEDLVAQRRSAPPRDVVLSGGDVDAAWDRSDEGEETVGGSHATPDQDVVDELGRAVGVTYNENEPLRLGEKEEERDRRRWELDPASSEDYQEHPSRGKDNGEA